MKILSLYLQRPGHALEAVTNWYIAQGHDVDVIRLPFGKFKQYKIGATCLDKNYDVVVTAEPNAALGLLEFRERFGKLVFWRIDYVPTKFFGLYWLGNRIISTFAEVWSIVPTDNSRERYVPYLLEEKEFVYINGEERKAQAVCAGPSLVELSHSLAGMKILLTHWGSTISDEDWRKLLASSKIGLALYGPELKYKKYSDPSRVKKYLACGLVVIGTGPAPFLDEMQAFGAGFHTFEDYYHISATARAGLTNFDKMSKKAYQLAEKYIVSEKWVGL